MSFFENFNDGIRSVPVAEHVTLDKFTTLRVGGPADYFAEPESEAQLLSLLRAARDREIPVLLLGNGSNVLVRDGGFRGLVIRLGKGFSQVECKGNQIYAQAGALLSAVARAAQEHHLTGLEFAHGIPGTVGGGAYMNAGAYGGELANVISSLRVLKGDAVTEIPVTEMDYGYRRSRAMEEGWIITGVTFSLLSGSDGDIDAAMRDFASRRREKQPLEYPSAGSFFKRPKGHFAGALIEGAGLKGLTVGGAQVSEKHAGFLINRGGASAADFLGLMAAVQQKVADQYGVKLEPEVRIVGSDR